MDHYVAVRNYNYGRLNVKTCLLYIHRKKAGHKLVYRL